MAIRLKNLLTNILFWIAMIFMAYFAENVVVFDLNNFQRSFSLIEYILLFVGIVILLSYYFHWEHKYNGLKTKWLLMIALLIIVISASIGIFLTPEIQYFETIEIMNEVETVIVKEFVTSFTDKIKSFLFVLIAAVGIYIQVTILPRLISFRRYVLFLMYVIVVVAVISAFVSYFMDFDSYVHLYFYGLVGYVYPQSFVFNRNMYALILMLGMLALYAIIPYLPKWYNYVFLIFLFVNIFFTFSKAAFGIAIITFVIHFIFRIVVTFKKNKTRNVIFLVIMGIAAVFGILLIPSPLFMNVKLFNEARRFILEYYIELGIGSYDGRREIWRSVISITSGVHLWFGRGLLIFNKTLFFYNGEISVPSRYALFSHNGFLEILGQWGLIGLIPYCLGVVAIFVIDIIVAIKNYKIGIPALIIFGAFLGYTIVETSTLFDITIEGVTTTALVTLPALSWLYAKRHPEINSEIMQNAESIEYRLPSFDIKRFEKKSARYLAVFFGIATLFAFFYFYKLKSEISVYLMFSALVSIILATLPRTIANIYFLKAKKVKLAFWSLFLFSLLIGFASLFAYSFTQYPYIFVFASKLNIINFLITEKFFNNGKRPIEQYLTKTIIHAFSLLLSIVLPVTLIIFMYNNLTLFILAEIATLVIIITAPFISEFELENSKINKKMLLAFARNVNN